MRAHRHRWHGLIDRLLSFHLPVSHGAAVIALIGIGLQLPGALPTRPQAPADDSPPLPVLWISLDDCVPLSGPDTCASQPKLRIDTHDSGGSWPQGLTIELRLGERQITCLGLPCITGLPITDDQGLDITFWAAAPEKQRGPTYSARARMLPIEDPSGRAPDGWYVQILSTQWAGHPLESCSVLWEAFPPLQGLPAWLANPEQPEALATEVQYHFLAARLIAEGAVDAGDCPAGGWLEADVPNACGMQRAAPLLTAWQNQFDPVIIQTAAQAHLPATLLKDLIAQESQFWPGSIPALGEFGLAHLTDDGADNTLLWNRPFYDSFCPSAFPEAYCNRGYAQLSDYGRSVLRAALLDSVNADCNDCTWGVDLARARTSVSLLGETLQAYCSQTARMIFNTAHCSPGKVSSYEDLWKITLASYAAGPGCTSSALKRASADGKELSWENVSGALSDPCTGAVDYVERIGH
jgi:hypothetical protein